MDTVGVGEVVVVVVVLIEPVRRIVEMGGLTSASEMALSSLSRSAFSMSAAGQFTGRDTGLYGILVT